MYAQDGARKKGAKVLSRRAQPRGTRPPRPTLLAPQPDARHPFAPGKMSHLPTSWACLLFLYPTLVASFQLRKPLMTSAVRKVMHPSMAAYGKNSEHMCRSSHKTTRVPMVDTSRACRIPSQCRRKT